LGHTVRRKRKSSEQFAAQLFFNDRFIQGILSH